MRGLLRSWLGISEIEDRVTTLEYKVEDMDDRISGVRQDLGTIDRKTREEIQALKSEVDDVAEVLDNIISAAQDDGEVERAEVLLEKIRRYTGTVERHLELAA